MALLIYSNGIVEEMIPIEETFSHRELVKTFDDYPIIQSHRLDDIPNTWCLWGEIDDPPDQEWNKIASAMIDDEIYSHLILIHDSEINRDWEAIDDILQKSYKDWMKNIASYTNELIDQMAQLRQQNLSDNEKTSMIWLTQLGHTEDKRVLFGFNPKEQSEDFYTSGAFEAFGTKIFEYLETNFYKEPVEESKPFVCFADSKTIIIVENNNVPNFIQELITIYEKREDYEICAKISKIEEKWNSYLKIPEDIKTEKLDPPPNPQKKKRGRPPKAG
jgi:hypothetical protein